MQFSIAFNDAALLRRAPAGGRLRRPAEYTDGIQVIKGDQSFGPFADTESMSKWCIIDQMVRKGSL